MKNKKVLIIGFVILAVLLIGAGTIYSLYGNEQPQKKPGQEESEKPNDGSKENVNEEAEKYKVAEMKSIITPDNKIRFGRTSIYRCNDVSGMMLNIIPYEDFDKVFVEMTLKLSKSEDNIIIGLENLKKDEQIEYEVQSLKDWSNLKSWSIKIITEADAIAKGYVKAAE